MPEGDTVYRTATNLINIAGAAKHEVLILSDADIVVGRDYVRDVAAALSAPGVGLVSCLYLGQDRGGLWSRFSAMAINYRFIPSAILGKAAGLAEPCFGATVAIRTDVLARVGGFAAFTATARPSVSCSGGRRTPTPSTRRISPTERVRILMLPGAGFAPPKVTFIRSSSGGTPISFRNSAI